MRLYWPLSLSSIYFWNYPRKKVLMRSSYYFFLLLDKILYSTLNFFEILHIVLIYSMKSLVKQWKKKSINQSNNLIQSIPINWSSMEHLNRTNSKKKSNIEIEIWKKLQSIINHDKLKLNVGRKKKKIQYFIFWIFTHSSSVISCDRIQFSMPKIETNFLFVQIILSSLKMIKIITSKLLFASKMDLIFFFIFFCCCLNFN